LEEKTKDKTIASTILQEGVDFAVTPTKPTFLHKIHLLKPEKRFRIYPICLGSLLKISEIINSIESIDLKSKKEDTFLESAITQIVNSADKMAEIIALAIWNKPFSNNKLIGFFQRLKVKRLTRYFLANLINHEIVTILNLVINQMDINYFFACLVSMKGLNLTATEIKKGKKETSGDK